MASADAPMKGIATLLEAFAKLRTERRRSSCCWSPSPQPGGRTEQLIDQLAIRDHVRFVHGISDAELVELMGSAEVACVPSLYEGFSLPTAELMACATPLVVSRAGAIPEVVGPGRARAPTWSRPATSASWPRRSARCSTTPSAGPRYGAAGRAPGRGAVQLARRRGRHRRGVRGRRSPTSRRRRRPC